MHLPSEDPKHFKEMASYDLKVFDIKISNGILPDSLFLNLATFQGFLKLCMEILEQQVVCAGIHNEDTIDTEQAKLKKKGLAKPEKFYFDNRCSC